MVPCSGVVLSHCAGRSVLYCATLCLNREIHTLHLHSPSSLMPLPPGFPTFSSFPGFRECGKKDASLLPCAPALPGLRICDSGRLPLPRADPPRDPDAQRAPAPAALRAREGQGPEGGPAAARARPPGTWAATGTPGRVTARETPKCLGVQVLRWAVLSDEACSDRG